MNLVCFDCDSTLTAIEGIDELGRFRGPDTLAQVEAMTDEAMNGRIPVEAVFGRRLEIIRPRREEVAAVGRRYIENIEPAARATVTALRRAGWTPVIVSGGFTEAIRPLADALDIQRVEAVGLTFEPDGSYRGFDTGYPTTRSGGKAEIVRRLRRELVPGRAVMVGDGASDLDAKPEVDLFVGFGGYVARPSVEREAGAFIRSLADLPGLMAALQAPSER
ncbi:MAG: HAD-IB family phosphatase [Opitutaceae bacterium]